MSLCFRLFRGEAECLQKMLSRGELVARCWSGIRHNNRHSQFWGWYNAQGSMYGASSENKTHSSIGMYLRDYMKSEDLAQDNKFWAPSENQFHWHWFLLQFAIYYTTWDTLPGLLKLLTQLSSVVEQGRKYGSLSENRFHYILYANPACYLWHHMKYSDLVSYLPCFAKL